jgi:hypothetical protein
MAQLAGDGFLMIELRDLSVPEWRKWLELLATADRPAGSSCGARCAHA